MMKRKKRTMFPAKIALLQILAVLLMGCGPAGTAENLARDIVIGPAGDPADAGKNDDKADGEKLRQEEAQESGASTGQNKEEGVFCFSQEGTMLVPGEIFDRFVLGEYAGVSEVPSCAFDGNDMVYDYGTFELTTYVDGETEYIYSIYFIDPDLTTSEGLCMGDTVEKMKSLYGENFKMVGTAYNYTRENTMLSVITWNDVVVGIEYRLNR